MVLKIINSITSDAWATLFGSLLGIIISAIVSNIVSTKNIKSQQENIDRQINAEVEKIEIQYRLEQKRDNINYLNKFKIEKLAELYELIGQYARYSTKLNLLIQEFFRKNPSLSFDEEEVALFKDNRAKIEEDFFEKNIMRKITILVAYFPNLRKKWEELTSYQSRYIDYLPDQIIGTLVIKQDGYDMYKIPENYTLKKYLDDLQSVNLVILNLIKSIEDEIEIVMNFLND